MAKFQVRRAVARVESLDAAVAAVSLPVVATVRADGGAWLVLRRHGFLLGLLLAVLAAWVFPQGGARDAWIPPQPTGQVGIALILFMQGLSLPLARVRAGAANWRLHSLVQVFTFGVFPLAGLALDRFVPGLWPDLPGGLRQGLLYLCVLPSTISTAVVFTAVARGNTAAALFNAAFSNLLGVLLTPLLVQGMMHAGAGDGPGGLGAMLGKIAMLTLLPFALGALLRPRVAGRVDAGKAWVARISNFIVLYLVYAAFCESVNAGLWQRLGPAVLWPVIVLSLLLFGVISGLVGLAAALLRLDHGDRVAAWFCAGQKTLAMGVPLAALIFGSRADLPLILLPVMIYHPLQLLVHGVMASRWSRAGGD